MDSKPNREKGPTNPGLADVVLFDLDGTLTDSAEGIKNGFCRAMSENPNPAKTFSAPSSARR